MLVRVLVLALVACGGDGTMTMVDRHAPGTCDATWIANGFSECETGCVDSSVALLAKGPGCPARTLAGNSVNCQATFVFDGITGCCASDPPQLYFADCL